MRGCYPVSRCALFFTFTGTGCTTYHTHTQQASRESQDPVVHARDTHSRVHFRGRNSPHKACTIVGTFLLSMCSEFSIALVITIVLIGDSESTQTQPLKPMATSNLTCCANAINTVASSCNNALDNAWEHSIVVPLVNLPN